MKLTVTQLRRIIREEASKTLRRNHTIDEGIGDFTGKLISKFKKDKPPPPQELETVSCPFAPKEGRCADYCENCMGYGFTWRRKSPPPGADDKK